MSLSSFIAGSVAIRQGFAARLPRPRITFVRALQVAPHAINNPLLASAFGYLLRFHLQRLNPEARVPAEWRAEAGAALIGMGQGAGRGREVTTVSRHPRQLRAAAYVADAKRRCQTYVQDGQVTEELLVASSRMAHLDMALRSGPERIDWRSINYLRAGDAAELKALLKLVDDATFHARRSCMVDPRPIAADLVRGADPDFILDNCIIDVSMLHEARFDVRDYFRLIAYYLLLGLGGISGENGKVEQCPVTSIGIYFARFGQLWSAPIREIVPPAVVADIARWFVGAACAANPGGLELLRGCRGPLAAHVLSADGALIPAKKIS